MIKFLRKLFKKPPPRVWIASGIYNKRKFYLETVGGAHMLIVGRTRSGKTYGALGLAGEIRRTEPAAMLAYCSTKSLDDFIEVADDVCDPVEEPAEYIALLNKFLALIKDRHKDRKTQHPVAFLILDEILDYVSDAKDHKESGLLLRQILTKGAESRVYVLALTQSALAAALGASVPIHGMGVILITTGASPGWCQANNLITPPALEVGQFFVARGQTPEMEGFAVKLRGPQKIKKK